MSRHHQTGVGKGPRPGTPAPAPTPAFAARVTATIVVSMPAPKVQQLGRRRALTALGVLGVSRYVPACSSSQRSPDTGTFAGTGGRSTGTQSGGNSGLDSGALPGETTCVLTPAQTEGPFFTETGLMRSDIREGKPGVALALNLRVVEAGSCAPLAGALVEVWHADAAGVYSAFDAAPGETFLRGFQRADAEGRVEFLSIYPGWYPGRTPHIHVMVLTEARRLLTTQLYFPEAVTDAVYALPPYAARGPRSTTNASDGIGGVAALLGELSEMPDGYATAFRMVVNG